MNLALVILIAALAFLEVFIGGARLLYAIPGICLLGVAGILTLLPGSKSGGKPDLAALLSATAFTTYIILRNRLSEIEYIARLQLFIMAGSLIAYLMLSLILTQPKQRKILFGSIIILALIQLYPALIQFTQGNHWMPLSWAQRQDANWRASGFFISPNNFAGLMELACLMATSLAIWGRTGWIGRMLFAYGAIASAAGVLISGSRGGYLSLTAGLGIIIILSMLAWGRQRAKSLIGAAVVGGALIVIVTGGLWWALQSSSVSERMAQINDPQNMRLLLWKSALQQFDLSPIWGTGGFSFLYFGRLFRDPMVQNDPIHVHNDYIQLLADYGLVGAGLFLLLLGAHLRAGVTGFRHLVWKSPEENSSYGDRLPLIIGSLAGLSAYMVHSVVDFNMQLPLNALVMAMLLGVIANPGGRSINSRTQPGHLRRTILRWLIPALGATLLIYGIPKIPGEFYSEKARVTLRDGNAKEALDIARTGLATTKNNPELYFQAGDAALHLSESGEKDAGRFHLESVEMFTKGLAIFPYDSRLALKLAMAQASLGDYYTAVETMNYAKKLDPNSAFVPAYRGYIEYLFRYYDDAEASFHNAIDIGGEGSGIAIQGIELVEKARNQARPLINTATSAPDLQIQESRDGTIPPQTNSRIKNRPPTQNFNAPQAPSSMEGSDGVMAPSVNQH